MHTISVVLGEAKVERRDYLPAIDDPGDMATSMKLSSR
jgi:hypothetical protein